MTEEQYIQYLRLVGLQERVDKATAETLRQMQSTYQDAIIRILEGVYRGDEKLSTGVQAKILKELQAGLDVVTLKATNDVGAVSAATWIESAGVTSDIISWDNRVVDFTRVESSLADAMAGINSKEMLGGNLDRWIGNVFEDTAAGIKLELNAGRIAGASYPEIAATIAGKLKKDAFATRADGTVLVRNGKPVRLNPNREMITITRSYIQEANVNAQTAVYAANRDIVEKGRWTATLENGNLKTGRGTCPRCAALDGQEFDLDENGQPKGGPHCTLHPRCRCLITPVTKTWKELGFDLDEMEDVYRPFTMRAEEAINLGGGREILDVGQNGTTYKDFFFSQDSVFQDNAVGPRRAEMLRQKYIEFPDMVDEVGRFRSIEELRKIHKIPGKGSGGLTLADGARGSEWYDTLPIEGKGYAYFRKVAPILNPLQQKAMAKVVNVTGELEMKHNPEGAFFQPMNTGPGFINMPPLYEYQRSGSSTFIHEFGHYADFNMAEQIPDKIKGTRSGSWGKRPISQHSKYDAAREADHQNMQDWGAQDADILAAAGFDSPFPYTRESDAVNKVLNKHMPKNPSNDKVIFNAELSTSYEAYLDENATGHVADLYKMTKAKKIYLQGSGGYNDALLELATSQEYGIKGNLASRWLNTLGTVSDDRDGGLSLYLTDLVGGTTGEDFGRGHGVAYYLKDESRRGAQAFANLFLTFEYEEAQGFLDFFTPKQKAIFAKIIKVLTK